jgi:predicted nucleotidyltransferase
MTGEINRLLEKAASVLKAAGAREVYVFGSALRGELRENSDLDLAVSGLPPEAFYRALAKASRAVDRPLDLVDLDEDTAFVRHLKNEGELQREG